MNAPYEDDDDDDFPNWNVHDYYADDDDDVIPFDSDAPEPVTGEIDINDAQTHVPIDHRRLRSLVAEVLRGEGIFTALISLALVDDATIHRVNREHLDHDCPTDVISFVLSDEGDSVLSGELIVSTETAARVAAEIGAPAWNEVALYVVHGLLHLCGYDDLDEDSAATMRQREDAALAREGLMNPFRLADPRRSESQPGSQ